LAIATARALGVSLLDRRAAPLVDGIPQISVQELKRRLDAKEDVFVLDVREPHEVQIVNIGAPLIPLGDLPKRVGELAAQKDREIVVHCKSGGRSQMAALILKNAGFPRVGNLAGGILAWAEQIDPTLPKY
jgi:adenylyltransferase/sulfurtransferase